MFILNKGNLYLFDLNKKELSMLKPRLFSPEPSNCSSLLITSSYLFAVSKFNCYNDCFIFKTSLENILSKWNSSNLISYENLLNQPDCSDINCCFNVDENLKEIYVNKKVLCNFSLNLKRVVQASNTLNFTDVNYIAMYNILNFIYSNFNCAISDIEPVIMNEIVRVLLSYHANSLLNIILEHIVLTDEKAVQYYEMSIKHNVPHFTKRCAKYIIEHLKGGLKLDEGQELKYLLYENYFCDHKIFIQCNIAGLDIKNVSQMTITNEKINEIKELSKEGKLIFCLNCKKVFKAEP